MAKIRHNKRFYTPQQAEAMLKAQQDQVIALEDQLSMVRKWEKAMMATHQPYASGRVDVSTSGTSKLRADFLDRLSRNLFCTECQSTWPCVQVERLRTLARISWKGQDPAVSESDVAAIKPRDRNFIPTAI